MLIILNVPAFMPVFMIVICIFFVLAPAFVVMICIFFVLAPAFMIVIRILFVLFEAELCVCDLAAALNMTQSAISHQLRVLKQARLVRNRREGKTIFYFLADYHVRTIIGQGMEHIEE